MAWLNAAALVSLAVLVSAAHAEDGKATAAGGTCNTLYGFYSSSWALSQQWADLSWGHRGAATTCGWDKNSWDGPSDCSDCYVKLSKEKQKATVAFDTDPDCHDIAMNLLGRNCTKKSGPISWKRFVRSRCEATTAKQLARVGIAAAGASSVAAASKSWKRLSTDLRAAATTCGNTKKSWDGPPQCRACFSDLDAGKQQALLRFGTDATCYNRFIQTSWGINCSQFSKDVPDAKRRSDVYAKLSKQEKFEVVKGFPSGMIDVPFVFGAVSSSLVLLATASAVLAFANKAYHSRADTQHNAIDGQNNAEETLYELVSMHEPECVA